MKPAAVYLRVSTDDQDEENQRADAVRLCEARGWKPSFYIDHGLSGRTTDRAEYRRMMKDAKGGRLSAVVVWKLDRLGRSVRQLVGDMDNLGAWGVDLVSVQDPIDTTSAFGRAMFQLAAVFAELEANIISERTRSAYLARKARAKNLGRKVRWGRKAAEVPPECVAAAGAGMSARAISAEFGVSRRVAGYAVEMARNGGVPDAGDSSPETDYGTESSVSVPGTRNPSDPAKVAGSEGEDDAVPATVDGKVQSEADA